MGVNIGTIFGIKLSSGTFRLMAHEDVFDFNVIVALFSTANNNLHVTVEKQIAVDGYYVYVLNETEEIINKFIYWLKKNNWSDLGKMIQEIEFIKTN